MVCAFCPKILRSHNRCGACYAHKHLSSKIKEYQSDLRKKTTLSRAVYSAKYRAANRLELLSNKRVWTKKNRLENPEQHSVRQKKRMRALALATPGWLTDEQRKQIQWFYDMAKELQWLSEELLTVDHIIPLQGRSVRGLHVPWNLQILPHSLNCQKGNQVKVG